MEDLLDRTRCPHCRASVRPDAPWCGLCHADLRPAPVPTPEPVPVPVRAPAVPAQQPAAAATDDRTDDLTDGPTDEPTDGPTWPCATCGARNPLAADACTACGAGFLAGLRESEGPLLELPGVGDLTRMSRGQRMLVAFGVVLAVVALTALLGLLLS